MNVSSVNTKKEAKAFMAAIIDPEKIVGQDGPLCKFGMAIPWDEYERIRGLAA